MKLKSLQNLNKLQRELKAKTIDKVLTDNTFFERTSELFKPLINQMKNKLKSLDKQETALVKTLKNTDKNSSLPLTLERLEPRKSNTPETGGNSWFKEGENGVFYPAGSKAKTGAFESRRR